MTTTTTSETRCARCSERIEPNQLGGWFAPGRLAMGAGHRSALCPDGIHAHNPEAAP